MAQAKASPRNTRNDKSRVPPARRHWLDIATSIFALVAAVSTGCAAYFAYQQWGVADQSLRVANRAYVSSTGLSFIHYGFKDPDGHTRWIVSTLFENTGNTSTRNMRVNPA